MKVRLRLLLPVVLAAGALSAPAANAGLVSGVLGLAAPTCASTSHPFAQFGDSNAYYPLANNGFENGSTSWTLSGAGISKDNEPWYVNGSGRYALALPPGGSATSAPICINLLDPFFRMFARSMSANGDLKVQIIFHGLTGNLTGLLNYGSFSSGDYTSWSPTGTVPSLLALPLGTTSAQIRFTTTATRGLWEIDDVFVDPCIGRIG
jgi:hypothetical protein